MSVATNLYITDKSGKVFWHTVASKEFEAPEIRNLENHINAAKANPKHYGFLDIDTARIIQDGEPLMTNEELLAALEA